MAEIQALGDLMNNLKIVDENNHIDKMLVDDYSDKDEEDEEIDSFFHQKIVRQEETYEVIEEKIEEFESKIEEETEKYTDDYTIIRNSTNLLASVIKINAEDPTFSAEIVDNVVILNNILYGIIYPPKKELIQLTQFKCILRLPAFHKQKIPQRDDRWWDKNCSKFEDLMIHLKNSADNNETESEYYEPEILDEIIDLATQIVQDEYENMNVKISTNLLKMFKIAKYLELYFQINRIRSFYSEEQQNNTIYFNEFKTRILENLQNINPKNFFFHRKQYDGWIDRALLKVIHRSQNMLVLFGPYGYRALSKNCIMIDLDIKSIFEFKSDALSYFALNNLIELKLHNKKIHLRNLNDYVNIIFKGASWIDD